MRTITISTKIRLSMTVMIFFIAVLCWFPELCTLKDWWLSKWVINQLKHMREKITSYSNKLWWLGDSIIWRHENCVVYSKKTLKHAISLILYDESIATKTVCIDNWWRGASVVCWHPARTLKGQLSHMS